MEAMTCRKCRRVLFLASATEPTPHPEKQGAAAKQECTSYWIANPPVWMREAITAPPSAAAAAEQEEGADEAGPNEGKLTCPGCQARFGSFCWSGTTCSCGLWVVPGIQVPKSKVDRRAFTAESLARLGLGAPAQAADSR